MSSWTSERGRVAALARCIRAGEREPNDPQYLEALRNLRTLRLAEYIEEVLSKAPPLTSEQRNQLAELLRPARTGVAP